ncbi:MAG: DUF3256 family protein, partial [Bacteroidales bacterium]|nr:DUF3256 family protein [Bacteroidales bacterium]
YIDRTHRQEMTDFIAMGLKGDVDNSLQGKSIMDTLTHSYIHVTLNESASLQLRRLPLQGGDSIVCVVRTWKGPGTESEVSFYDQDWQVLNACTILGSDGLEKLSPALLVRPDTMGQARFEELAAKFDPLMVSARLFVDSDDLEVSLTLPEHNSEIMNELKAIVRLIRLKWNGKTFNKV